MKQFATATAHYFPFLKRLVFCSMIILIALSSQAQIDQLKTESFTSDNGMHSYTATILGHPDTTAVDYWNYLLSNPHSGIVVVAAHNGKYNCHAFAWPNDSTVWVEGTHDTTKAPQIYYDHVSDYYYHKITDATDAEIAVYGSDPLNNPTHSAVRLTNSTNSYARAFLKLYPQYAGWYISKWDGGPLVIHQLDSCPFYSASMLPTLYKKKAESSGSNHVQFKGSDYSIIGPKAFCSFGQTFELGNVFGTNPISAFPSGFSVSWTCSSHVTLSPNANSYPVTASSSVSSAAGEWIKATIHFPDGTSDTVTRAALWSGVPAYISSISTSQFTAGGTGYIAINVSQSGTDFYGWPFNQGDLFPPNGIDVHGASSYTWSCSGLGYTQNPSTIDTRYTAGYFSGTGAAVITIHGWNACGSTSEYQTLNVTSSGFAFAMSPNPASGQVTVNVAARQATTGQNLPAEAAPAANVSGLASGAPVVYTIKITDVFGILYYTSKQTGNSFSIPVSGLKSGNYVVQISDGKTVSSKPLLIAH
jgi:hypothetical protein